MKTPYSWRMYYCTITGVSVCFGVSLYMHQPKKTEGGGMDMFAGGETVIVVQRGSHPAVCFSLEPFARCWVPLALKEISGSRDLTACHRLRPYVDKDNFPHWSFISAVSAWLTQLLGCKLKGTITLHVFCFHKQLLCCAPVHILWLLFLLYQLYIWFAKQWQNFANSSLIWLLWGRTKKIQVTTANCKTASGFWLCVWYTFSILRLVLV